VRLYLLRHGEAEAPRTNDARRALTEHGRAEVRASAALLAGIPLQAILASPYVRTQQTAELAATQLGYRGVIESADWLTPDSDLRDALERLSERSEDELLLVTHQPLVGALGGLLVHGHRQQPLPMGTASLAILSGDLALAGGMQLVSLNHPQV
jgi:phosphohistidine phosphatase